MNNIKVFDGLKVKENNGKILFDAETAAIGIGLIDTSKGTKKVRGSRVNQYLKLDNLTAPKVALGDFITEPQLYKLAIKANSEQAEKFQDWVTSEVLPSIRKNGAYLTDQKAIDLINNPNETLGDLLIQAGEQLKKKDIQIAEMKPKAAFADAVTFSEDKIQIGELATYLKQNGVDIGRNRLFKWLRENGYLMGIRGENYNLPTQRSLNAELFVVEKKEFYKRNILMFQSLTKVTGHGQVYFLNKLLAE